MTSTLRRLAAMCSVVGLGVCTVSGRADGDYQRAPFWEIAADSYLQPGPPSFPETALLPGGRDIGVAFSGGGVRSASATIGELRGLREAGLLDRVQYVSAVSGGGWAVIPWIFSGQQDLLGRYDDPRALALADVTSVPNGVLSRAVADVSLALAGSKEAGLEAWAFNVPPESQGLLKLVRRALGGAASQDRTYATLLGRTLLAALGDDAYSDFEWHEAQSEEFAILNGPRTGKAIPPQPGRPFMIINAHVVNAGADFKYPYAVPFEITPLYVGARQSIGGVFGGVYTWPAAYNAATARVVQRRDRNGGLDYCAMSAAASPAGPASGCANVLKHAGLFNYSGILEYSHDESHARMSLADAAAATGAAPLFWIVGGSGLSRDIREFIRVQGGSFFPEFTHLALRDGDVPRAPMKWAHADGGARDNLGIAALLARQVKKIVVFVNADDPNFAANADVASLFEPGAAGTTGDKRENVMFTTGAGNGQSYLRDIRRQWADARTANAPLVACGVYDVKANRVFNIRAYQGVRVCWVYTERVEPWVAALPPPVKSIVQGGCADCGTFERFPWFRTFAENHDIKHVKTVGLQRLTNAQVNLMTNLMAWTVLQSASSIRAGLDTER